MGEAFTDGPSVGVADPSQSAPAAPQGIAVDLTAETRESQRLLNIARSFSPGGVQGAGRWYSPFPLFIKRGQGARIWDVDDNEYIDYHAAYGPTVLGHNDPRVAK